MDGILYNEKYGLKNPFKLAETLSIKIIQIYLYSGLSLSRTRKGPTNLFEIEKITVKIKTFTNKAREVNRGFLGIY